MSDGTEAGTHMLMDIMPGGSSSWPRYFFSFNGLTWFTATGPEGQCLWVSDGTEAGTRGAFDPDPVPGGSGTITWIRPLSNGRILFTYKMSGTPSGLYVWDGGPSAPTRLRDLTKPELGGSAELNGSLIFAADGGDGAGFELWKSDGTPEGTVRLKDIFPGAESSIPDAFARVGDRVFFAATDDSRNVPSTSKYRGLWATDGTPEGTVEVYQGYHATQFINVSPKQIVDLNGVAVIYGNGRLWRSDGTAGGSALLAHDVSGGFGLYRLGDRVVFAASVQDDPYADGYELWETDGTAAGTRQIIDLEPDPGLSGVGSSAAILNGRLIFSGSSRLDGEMSRDFEPWISDGTAAGTARIADLNTEPQDSVYRPTMDLGNGTVLVNVNGRLYSAPKAGGPLTHLADLILLGPTSIDPAAPPRVVIDGVAIFAATRLYDDAVVLFRSDGTPDGTYQLTGFTLDDETNNYWGTGDKGASGFAGMGGHVYFGGYDPATGMNLWRSDGTQAGTQLVIDSAPQGKNGLWCRTIVATKDAVYFVAPNPGFPTGAALWRSDGTAAGTTVVLGPTYGPPADFSSGIKWLGSTGDRVFFQASVYSSSKRLFVTDGTLEGAAVISEGKYVEARGVAGGLLYFNDEMQGYLWRTDGTPEGTYAITSSQVYPGPSSIVSLDGVTYFATPWGRLWRTDGTPEGTFELSARAVSEATVSGGTLYFRTKDADHGYELWKLDEATGQPVIVQDPIPGPTGSAPEYLSDAGRYLFFGAFDPVHGGELRRVKTDLTPPAVAFAFVHDATPQRVRLTFSEPLALPPGEGDLVVTRTDGGGEAVAVRFVAYDPATRTATFGLAAPLGEGTFRATLAAGSAVDGADNALPAEAGFDFTVVPGDIDGDGRIDAADYYRIDRGRALGLTGFANGDVDRSNGAPDVSTTTRC